MYLMFKGEVPAVVVHAVTNLLPALVAYSDSFYQAHIVPMNGAGLVSAAVVGGISYLLMRKEKMFVQGGRKKHRLCGLVQMLPFPGIINGLLVPTMLVPTCFFALSAQETVIYQFILYWVLSMLLLLFYMKGKSWRSWFHENMQHRSLLKSEKYLLWIIGILMLLFSNHT